MKKNDALKAWYDNEKKNPTFKKAQLGKQLRKTLLNETKIFIIYHTFR